MPTSKPTVASVSESPANMSHTIVQPQKKSRVGCWIAGILGCLGVIVGIAIMFVMLAVLVADTGSTGSISENVLREGSDGKIALIRVEGTISQTGSEASLLSSAGASTDVIIAEIDQALADDDVKAILIKMNTPGGEVVASDLAYRKVLEARSEKPVVTWISSMGASGGYYIAAGSTEIIAHPQAMVGSIGVITEVTNMAGLYEKLGIETKTYTSGEYKDLATEAFDPNSDGTVDDMFQGLVDNSYDAFVDAIAEGRDMSRSDVEELADGTIFSGDEAVSNGLIDDVGDMDDAIASAEDLAGESGLSVVEYSTGGFWSDLAIYEQTLLERMNLLPQKTTYSVGLYYLLEL